MLENLNPLMPMEKKYGLQKTRTKPMSWLSFIVTFSLLRWTKIALFHCKQLLVCDDINLPEKLILEKPNSLDLSKSPGPDLSHPRVLYEVRHEIMYLLKLIFERSLKDQQLPIDWKSSTITAIFKKGFRSNVGNYRPVSLTCVICKL